MAQAEQVYILLELIIKVYINIYPKVLNFPSILHFVFYKKNNNINYGNK